mgnify:CR=1 FL=1
MVNRWITELESQGGAYIPPDSPNTHDAEATVMNTTVAQP